MNSAPTNMLAFKETLEQKQAELGHVLRQRDGITIEKSADQMDEIQYASERDLAIRNADRDSLLLREDGAHAKSAIAGLRRIERMQVSGIRLLGKKSRREAMTLLRNGLTASLKALTSPSS